MENIKWVSREDALPNDIKKYCVRITNGVITSDLRTPTVKYGAREYEWARLDVSHWMEIPTPWYPYKDNKGDWVELTVERVHNLKDRKVYFVTDRAFNVDVYHFDARTGLFYSTNDYTHVPLDRVLAVWQIPDFEFKE